MQIKYSAYFFKCARLLRITQGMVERHARAAVDIDAINNASNASTRN